MKREQFDFGGFFSEKCMLFAKCLIIFTHSKLMNFQIPDLQGFFLFYFMFLFCLGFFFFVWSERWEVIVGHYGIILDSRDGWTVKKALEDPVSFPKLRWPKPWAFWWHLQFGSLRAGQARWLHRLFLVELFYDVFCDMAWRIANLVCLQKKPRAKETFLHGFSSSDIYVLYS